MTERILALPRLGETMESGRIVEWLKRPGDTFRRGETLAEIETDKTVVELPALTDGTLLEILAEPGADITVDMPLARIDDENARPESAPTERSMDEDANGGNEIGDGAEKPAVRTPEGVTRATPAARHVARQSGVDIGEITGTGRRGRVESQDVRAHGGDRNRKQSTGDRISVSGGEIAVRRWRAVGERRSTALLLHGFGADGSSWAPIGPLLAKVGIDTLAFDLPAHGDTSVEADSVTAMTALVAEAIRPLSPVPDLLIGHSMGALLAAEVAVSGTAPGSARLVLIAPAGMGREMNRDLLHALANADSAETLDLLLREINAPLSPPPLPVCRQILEQHGRHPSLAALAWDLAGDAGQRYSLNTRLARLETPIHVIMGTRDALFPWTQISGLPPKTAIHLFEGAGHLPHWEYPEAVADIICRTVSNP